MIDIIYSILCHEAPDCMIDMICNIAYYHRDVSYLIVINTNVQMYNELKMRSIETSNVKLSQHPFDKKSVGYDITKGHILNFNDCVDASIESTYFIPLASNCMFHKQVTRELLHEFISLSTFPKERSYSDISRVNTDSKNGIWWSTFFMNIEVINTIKDVYNSDMFYWYQFEGIILPYSEMQAIVNFIKLNRIEERIQCDTCFDEILIQTLYHCMTGKHLATLCKAFWNSPDYSPSIDEMKETPFPCVKRVSRSYNDPIRIWLRTETNNYASLIMNLA